MGSATRGAALSARGLLDGPAVGGGAWSPRGGLAASVGSREAAPQSIPRPKGGTPVLGGRVRARGWCTPLSSRPSGPVSFR